MSHVPQQTAIEQRIARGDDNDRIAAALGAPEGDVLYVRRWLDTITAEDAMTEGQRDAARAIAAARSERARRGRATRRARARAHDTKERELG